MANQDIVDSFDAFGSSEAFKKEFEKLLNHPDPAVAVLALRGLFCIENEAGRGQERIRSFLGRWRNDSRGSCSKYDETTKTVLRKLTIFKTHEVPLFIDDFGTKNLLSSYDQTEDMHINLDTDAIYHVAHFHEAMSIANSKELRASDNKNVVEGCWFGLIRESPTTSVYGSRAFKTTLSKLGVRGVRQGEIVSYEEEVNVILYADDEGDTNGVKKPTEESAKRHHKNPKMYVKVSIFVPKRFLPKPDNFDQVISGPYKVKHDGFCVRRRRTGKACFELRCEELMEDVRGYVPPATIIWKINSWPRATREEKIRAVSNLFVELCFPDPSLPKQDQFNNLTAFYEYRRDLLDAFEKCAFYDPRFWQ